MKKRLLSWFIVLTMLATAVCVPVSASTGMLSEKSISDIVIYANNTEKEYVNTANQTSGTLGTVHQHVVTTFVTDTASDDYYGALSFKIKANEANLTTSGSRDTFTVILNNTLTGSEKVENNVFIMDFTGYMHATGGYNLSEGMQYNKGQYYTIGLVFKKDQTYDFYVDGQLKSTETFVKNFAKDLANIKLLFNVSAEGKFMVDDLTWSKYSNDSFIAEGMATTAASGDTLNVKFSNPVASCDASKIKAYNCATGEELAGVSAALNGEYLGVTLPSGLEEGSEYRIELDGVKGAFGTAPATDNVYFSCLPDATTEDTIIYEAFEGYTTKYRPAPEKSAGNTNYYQPEGWYLKQRWTNLANGYIQPKTDNAAHGTVMQIGKITHDGGKVGAYLPFPEKVTSGKLSLSYDVKPEQLAFKGNTGGNFPNSSLFVMAYPETPTNYDQFASSKDDSKIQECDLSNAATGRVISGILGLELGNPTGDVTPWDLDKRAQWTDYVTFTEGVQSNADWYTMTVEFDFDADVMTWYLNGTEKDSSATLMSALGLDGGISGISFGMWVNVQNNSVLVDNIKVTKTYNAVLGNEEDVFSDNFNSFDNSGDAVVPALMDGDTVKAEAAYLPSGWGMGSIYYEQYSRYGSIVKAEEGNDGSTALKLGKKIVDLNSKSDAPWLYHTLGQEYTSGVINVSYDLTAKALPALGSSIAQLNALGETNTNGWQQHIWPRSFYFSVAPAHSATTGMASEFKPGWDGGNTSKHIFGIQNQEFAAYITNANAAYITLENGSKYLWGANYRKAVAIDDTYSIKHTIDLDNGVVKTYINDTLVSAASSAGLGIEKIGGICFGVDQCAYGTELLIDNVEVTYQEYQNLANAVMQVRFSDYYDNLYGAATTLTTVADTIGVTFWSDAIDTPVESNFALEDQLGNEIDFVGSFDEASNTYLMNLREYLTKDTQYTLTVSGITLGDSVLPAYTQKINSAVEGVVIVEPMYIMKGATAAASGALAEGDTVTAGTRVINTTGETKEYDFGMALYEDGLLKMVDFREVKQDGKSSKEDKEANLSCSFTMSAEDAASITNIKAFLWDGLKTMKPILSAIEFINTAATE